MIDDTYFSLGKVYGFSRKELLNFVNIVENTPFTRTVYKNQLSVSRALLAVLFNSRMKRSEFFSQLEADRKTFNIHKGNNNVSAELIRQYRERVGPFGLVAYTALVTQGKSWE